MKKIYALILFITPLFLQAQITLNENDLPKAGDVISSADCEIPNAFDIGQPGPNQVYDFSMLTPIDSFSTNFISAEGTVGSDAFPNANLAGEFDGDLVYYTQTDTELLLLGSYVDTSENGSGQYFATHFDPPTKIFQIPSTYNTTFTDMSSWTATFPDDTPGIDSFRTTSTLMDTVIFDGYGTVILPNGSHEALREMRISKFTTEFETYFMGTWSNVFSTTDTDTTYNWYGKNNPNLASVSIFDGEIFSISYSINEVQEVAPVADFTYTELENGTISFEDQSSNAPTAWSWDFGDGSTSTSQNPEHTFTTSDTYNVCLTATNGAGSNTYCEMIEIGITLAPVANFSVTDLENGTFSFEDQSTNTPTAWQWDFGDGNTSTAQNPEYTYIASGTYTVCLTASNSAGDNTYCDMVNATITGTNDFWDTDFVQVFPNPVSHTLTIKIKEPVQNTLRFQIVDISGQTVLSKQLDRGQLHTIPVHDLATGMYIYIIKDSDGLVRKRESISKL